MQRCATVPRGPRSARLSPFTVYLSTTGAEHGCTLAEVIMPKGSNSARSLSSSTSSTRFLMYRFMPWYFATRSCRISSNLYHRPMGQGKPHNCA